MSALGQKRTLQSMEPMSALPPKADIETQSRDVHFVPKADIPAYADLAAKGVDQFSSLFDDEHYCNLCCVASWCSEPHAGLIGVAG